MEGTPFLFFYTIWGKIRKRTRQFFFSGPPSLRAAAAVAGIALITSCTGTPEVRITTRKGAVATVKVEVARTPSERSLGLMYRSRLPEGRGMLFVEEREQVQPFTMRNTRISLDMIFISADLRVVGCVEKARPMTDGPYTIGKPSRYVLEVPAGFCQRYGISQGDMVSFAGIPGG